MSIKIVSSPPPKMYSFAKKEKQENFVKNQKRKFARGTFLED